MKTDGNSRIALGIIMVVIMMLGIIAVIGVHININKQRSAKDEELATQSQDEIVAEVAQSAAPTDVPKKDPTTNVTEVSTPNVIEYTFTSAMMAVGTSSPWYTSFEDVPKTIRVNLDEIERYEYNGCYIFDYYEDDVHCTLTTTTEYEPIAYIEELYSVATSYTNFNCPKEIGEYLTGLEITDEESDDEESDEED